VNKKMAKAEEQLLRRSPLYDAQSALGAGFDVVYGWEMAEWYSGFDAEHLAVRANAGLLDLSYHGAIRISGGEATQFLNGLVTNNVKSLAKGGNARSLLDRSRESYGALQGLQSGRCIPCRQRSSNTR
jgi:aminomethyltransferase